MQAKHDGYLEPQMATDLKEDVLPWLLAKRDEFLKDQTGAIDVSKMIIEEGILLNKRKHAKFLKARDDGIKAAEQEKLRQEEETRNRRAERAKAREKRAKDQAKDQLRSEIRRLLIEKSIVVTPAASAELLDIHGCYERGKQFCGAIGGQLMQWYYILNAILKIYPESDLKSFYEKMAEDPKKEELKQATTPRELMMEHFFVPFILTAVKELKGEFIQFLAMPEMVKLMEELKVVKNNNDLYDFTKLNQDQYMAFKHAMVTDRMFIDCYKVEENPRAMDMLLSTLCMIICGRVPKGIVAFKTDQLVSKVRIVQVAKGTEIADRHYKDVSGKPVTIKKNVNERAVVRILVPKRKMTPSEID